MTKPKEQVYRRVTPAGLNTQNAHMSISYELCNFALVALMGMGITVQRVEIVGRQPKITVLQSRACNGLKSEVITIRDDGGKRTAVRRAIVNGCSVEWETSVLH